MVNTYSVLQFTLPFFENTLLFLLLVVVTFAIIGLGSRYFSVASYSGFLVFVFLAVNTDNQLFMTLLYASLITVTVVMGFKLWSLLIGGNEI